MPGEIKKIIDKILVTKSNGNEALLKTTKTKLLLKGINPDKYDSTSPDDANIISKLQSIAKDMEVKI